MKTENTVIYNGSCPVCSREIKVYRARAENHGTGTQFVDLNEADLSDYGITADEAAREIHVLQNGQMLKGVDAFLAMWRVTPGFAWLARIVGLPGIKQVTTLVYRWILAPALYAAHRRRMRRATASQA
ncbi:MAG: DUF393 domain-containing protein [Pseudomonadota bacterium]